MNLPSLPLAVKHQHPQHKQGCPLTYMCEELPPFVSLVSR